MKKLLLLTLILAALGTVVGVKKYKRAHRVKDVHSCMTDVEEALGFKEINFKGDDKITVEVMIFLRCMDTQWDSDEITKHLVKKPWYKF